MELDLTALDRGFVRPLEPGWPLDARLVWATI
jgi:hypothetical protein